MTVNVLGSLVAAGVLQMRGINGWSGWQWLFLLVSTDALRLISHANSILFLHELSGWNRIGEICLGPCHSC